MNNKSFLFKPFWYHILFWIIFVMFPFVMRPANDNASPEELQRHYRWGAYFVSFAITNIPLFYCNTEILIKKILVKHGVLWYLLLVAATIPLMFWVQDTLLHSIVFSEEAMKGLPRGGARRGPVVGTSFQLLFVLVLGLLYHFITADFDEKEQRKEAERERLKSELSFLRSQISPHFMFNVLNSIVSLSRRKPDMVEPVVIRLSELMRYMIYETKDAKVSLEKEATYLESYIDLQRLRFGNDIEINYQSNIQRLTQAIEPMLLIPFVENAFKHGVGMVSHPSIDIELTQKEDFLDFIVKNKISPQAEQEQKDHSSGIGLSNVRRRLELLHPEHFRLDIHNTDTEFTVHLNIHFA